MTDVGAARTSADAVPALTARELDFDGIATVCVFAWEERAVDSGRFVLDRVTKELTG